MVRPAATEFLVRGDSKAVSDGLYEQWWLTDHGVTVAYIQVVYREVRPAGYPALTLCDIEVRPEFRRRGYGRDIIAFVQRHYDEVLHATGSFTPEGHAAFAEYLPIVPGGFESVSGANSDLTFVDDWDQCEPKYPL